ncbi:MAG: ArsR/SmtB family transcription factor [bacterium]
MLMNEEMYRLMAMRFKAMAEPARLMILQLLKEHELTVGEIAELTGMKHGTASANLVALAKAGLVTCRREGTKMYYRVSSEMVLKICDIACACIRQEIEEMVKMGRGENTVVK